MGTAGRLSAVSLRRRRPSVGNDNLFHPTQATRRLAWGTPASTFSKRERSDNPMSQKRDIDAAPRYFGTGVVECGRLGIIPRVRRPWGMDAALCAGNTLATRPTKAMPAMAAARVVARNPKKPDSVAINLSRRGHRESLF